MSYALYTGGVLTNGIDLTDDYAFAIEACDEVVRNGDGSVNLRDVIKLIKIITE